MCKVISIVNQKGGCSKTTSAVNIGIGLANAGKKVVLIDADAQGSLTASLGFQKPDELKVTLATIMAKTINEEEIDLSKVILHHEEGVDLVPGNIELSGLEVQLSNVLSRELILKEFIDSLRDFYDYILIDCAPSLGMMTINALVAADEVIIPVQAAYLPVKGLQQLMKTINMVKRRLNKKLQIDGILLAMVDYRTTFARNISAELFAAYGESVGIFENYIPSSIKAVEASSAGISIYKHDPKGKVAQAYELIVETVAYTGKKFVVASNELPAEFVKNRFMKLNFMHIQYVISSMKKNTTEIKNIKKYLLAALYNAPATMQGYYQAEVNHAMPQYAKRI